MSDRIASDDFSQLARHPDVRVHGVPKAAIPAIGARDVSPEVSVGVFKSVADLKAAIAEYIAVHNAKPKPFIWTAKASDILAKVTRARAILNKNTSN